MERPTVTRFSKLPHSSEKEASPKSQEMAEEHSHTEDSESEEDRKLKWLGQDQMGGRPNDWLHGYDPAYSTAYRKRVEEERKRKRKPTVKIAGYSGGGGSSVRDRCKNFQSH